MAIATKKRHAGATPAAHMRAVTTCETCAHYVSVAGTEMPEGVCRRNPPLPFLLTNGNVRSVYAPVRGDWSCGEYDRWDSISDNG